MTPVLPIRWLLLALCCLLLVAVPSFAAESTTTLQASFLMNILGDRSRMIQASVVCVLCGCALLWWRR